jgi:dihydroorotate dehydrogenase (NAD+) catalytic subunit
VDGFIQKYWPFLKGLKVPTIINIWGTTVEEYAEVARRFDALGGVGALELNVSCPNIKEGGAQFGTDCQLSRSSPRAAVRRPAPHYQTEPERGQHRAVRPDGGRGRQ